MGGILNPNKCCCMVYTGAPNKSGILCPNPPPSAAATIAVAPQHNSPLIPVLSPTEGTHYLGLYLNQTGTATPMEGHFWKKHYCTQQHFNAAKWHREAGILYHSCFLPALTCPLPVTSLSPNSWSVFITFLLPACSTKWDFIKNLPCSLIFAPRSPGGIWLCHLDHKQSTQKAIILVHHLQEALPLRYAIEALNLKLSALARYQRSCVNGHQTLPLDPRYWLSHLWLTMRTTCITTTYWSWTIPPLCCSNHYLMDDFLDQGLHWFKLECLNTCQMYLQVMTLSEITDHTGTEVLPQILSSPSCPIPKGLANLSYSLLHWLQIHPLSAECWKLWTSTIQTIYTGLTKGTHLISPWLPMHTSTGFGTGECTMTCTLFTNTPPLLQPELLYPLNIDIPTWSSHQQPQLHYLSMDCQSHHLTWQLDWYRYQSP